MTDEWSVVKLITDIERELLLSTPTLSPTQWLPLLAMPQLHRWLETKIMSTNNSTTVAWQIEAYNTPLGFLIPYLLEATRGKISKRFREFLIQYTLKNDKGIRGVTHFADGRECEYATVLKGPIAGNVRDHSPAFRFGHEGSVNVIHGLTVLHSKYGCRYAMEPSMDDIVRLFSAVECYTAGQELYTVLSRTYFRDEELKALDLKIGTLMYNTYARCESTSGIGFFDCLLQWCDVCSVVPDIRIFGEASPARYVSSKTATGWLKILRPVEEWLWKMKPPAETIEMIRRLLERVINYRTVVAILKVWTTRGVETGDGRLLGEVPVNELVSGITIRSSHAGRRLMRALVEILPVTRLEPPLLAACTVMDIGGLMNLLPKDIRKLVRAFVNEDNFPNKSQRKPRKKHPPQDRPPQEREINGA